MSMLLVCRRDVGVDDSVLTVYPSGVAMARRQYQYLAILDNDR